MRKPPIIELNIPERKGLGRLGRCNNVSDALTELSR
jgi:hypothetical protein